MRKRNEPDAEWLSAALAEQTELADIGELAGQISHEFNNFLNSLLLRISLLETERSDHVAAELADIRRQARHLADLIRQVQQSRREPAAQARTIDWHRSLKRAVDLATEQFSGQKSGIQLELSSRPLAVAGRAMDHQRLCSFLLRHRLIEPGAAARIVTVRTKVADDKAMLTIEDPRTKLTAAQIANLFEPDANEADNLRRLLLAACRAIVRRLQGRIGAKPLAQSGLVIEAEFPLLASP